MKIQKDHYEALTGALTNYLQKHGSSVAQFCESYRQGRLSPNRCRWDLLYKSRLRIGDGVGMDGLPLYAYMDDTHIDTALRHYMRENGCEWAAKP